MLADMINDKNTIGNLIILSNLGTISDRPSWADSEWMRLLLVIKSMELAAMTTIAAAEHIIERRVIHIKERGFWSRMMLERWVKIALKPYEPNPMEALRLIMRIEPVRS